jgi:hypothetical protein
MESIIINIIQTRFQSWKRLPKHEDHWLHLNSLYHKEGSHYFHENIFKMIPKDVKKLFMSHNILGNLKNIPYGITHLHLGNCFFSYDYIYEFPPKLEFLSLRNADIMYGDIPRILKALPQNLHTLILCNTKFQDEWVCFLPRNLKVLNVRGTMITQYPFVNHNTKVLYEDTPYDTFLKKTKKRCMTLKEDLMIYTWHPNRMFDWCLDFEEQQELLSCG